MTDGGESRPDLTSANWATKQEQLSTGRGDDSHGALNAFVLSEGGTSNDTYHIRREPYALYDRDQAARMKVVAFAFGSFFSVVLFGLASLTVVALAGKSGDLIGGYLTAVLIPVTSLLTGVGGYFFGQRKALVKPGPQQADTNDEPPLHPSM